MKYTSDCTILVIPNILELSLDDLNTVRNSCTSAVVSTRLSVCLSFCAPNDLSRLLSDKAMNILQQLYSNIYNIIMKYENNLLFRFDIIPLQMELVETQIEALMASLTRRHVDLMRQNIKIIMPLSVCMNSIYIHKDIYTHTHIHTHTDIHTHTHTCCNCMHRIDVLTHPNNQCMTSHTHTHTHTRTHTHTHTQCSYV
eukprot:GHVR01008466.1.p1 GENE.GHVR01008466.1~~GHVR01008466.1.p1  ORF type:complete len:198 (+),score=106.12 GHVR01008466.1:56-649(+)